MAADGAAGARAAPGSSPSDDFLMVRAARGEPVERTPVWLFRQAGRHLPEYREYKERNGKDFLKLLQDPRDVAEVTMQPLRRYDLDAAILFSDILVVAQALGIDVEMPGGQGILVTTPLNSPKDMVRLPESVDIRAKLPHVLDSVSLINETIRKEAMTGRLMTKGQQRGAVDNREGPSRALTREVPLIGFSAAPWTLLFYMVGGHSKRNTSAGREWLEKYPAESQALMELITEWVVEYLCAQADAGAHMLQLFEAMGDHASEEQMRAFALPHMLEIRRRVRERHPTVPLFVFARGATYLNVDLQLAGFDVVTLDLSCESKATRAKMNAAAADAGIAPATLQGNFDPKLLRAGLKSEANPDGGATEISVVAAARECLEELRPEGLIFNLGEGLSGKEDPVKVNWLVDTVHAASWEILNGLEGDPVPVPREPEPAEK